MAGAGPNGVAAPQLLPQVYEQLRDLAAGYLRGQGPCHTLQPTALVHEAYLKLLKQSAATWGDPTHFMSVAARAMRQILVDHARAKGTLKRGGDGQRWSILPGDASTHDDEIDLLSLDTALSRLGALDERKARVVELRFFAGLTVTETAHVLGVSPATVEGDWRFARAWLRDQLSR